MYMQHFHTMAHKGLAAKKKKRCKQKTIAANKKVNAANKKVNAANKKVIAANKKVIAANKKEQIMRAHYARGTG